MPTPNPIKPPTIKPIEPSIKPSEPPIIPKPPKPIICKEDHGMDFIVLYDNSCGLKEMDCYNLLEGVAEIIFNLLIMSVPYSSSSDNMEWIGTRVQTMEFNEYGPPNMVVSFDDIELQHDIYKYVDYVVNKGQCKEGGNGDTDLLQAVDDAMLYFDGKSKRKNTIIVVSGCKNTNNMEKLCGETVHRLHEYNIDLFAVNLIKSSNAKNVIIDRFDAKEYLYCLSEGHPERICVFKDEEGVSYEEFGYIIEHCLVPGICKYGSSSYSYSKSKSYSKSYSQSHSKSGYYDDGNIGGHSNNGNKDGHSKGYSYSDSYSNSYSNSNSNNNYNSNSKGHSKGYSNSGSSYYGYGNIGGYSNNDNAQKNKGSHSNSNNNYNSNSNNNYNSNSNNNFNSNSNSDSGYKGIYEKYDAYGYGNSGGHKTNKGSYSNSNSNSGSGHYDHGNNGGYTANKGSHSYSDSYSKSDSYSAYDGHYKDGNVGGYNSNSNNNNNNNSNSNSNSKHYNDHQQNRGYTAKNVNAQIKRAKGLKKKKKGKKQKKKNQSQKEKKQNRNHSQIDNV